MFEFLFKYPADYFSRGTLVLGLPGWQIAFISLAILAFTLAALGYSRLRERLETADRLAIALLRSVAIYLVMFSLLRPLLEVISPLPQPSVVGVLLDNSLSMRIADSDGRPRSEFVSEQFDAENGDLLRALRERFDTRLFRFGAGTAAIDDVGELDYADGDSDLARALEQVRQMLKSEPLAGLVVIGDGAIQAGGQMERGLLALRTAGIPVHTVGLGQAQYDRDIELSRVDLPRQILRGSRVVADVSIRQRGYDGRKLDLVIEDDSRILQRLPIELSAGAQSVKIPLSLEDSGSRQLDFYIAGQADEQISANNRQQAVLSVDDRRIRILHFEGEPRFELKFIRRAVADDENLQLSGLIRTADAKFYRIGIESADQLRNGFPGTREELFTYDALILGSVENTLLSHEQQQMIAEFVSERGGGLIMLGGRHAFSEGGYRDSVLHDISPVVMDEAQPDFSRQIDIRPTPAAWTHPALLLADNNEKSIARWLTLPSLTIVNPIRRIKPGATLLLTSSPQNEQDPYVAMAMQRYGRGKVIAFPVQNSWLWQMHQQIDIEDQTHELLWRQLLRWLVESVPERLDLSLSSHRIPAGGVIRLRSEVLMPDFSADEAASPRVVLTAQDGRERVEYLARNPSQPGVYNGDIAVAEPGDYLVRVELEEAGEVTASEETRFEVSAAGSEYHQSEMNEALLRTLARDTEGRFFRPSDAAGLAEALDNRQRRSNALVRYELWDMPVIFLLLVLCLGTEWVYRRWRGLV